MSFRREVVPRLWRNCWWRQPQASCTCAGGAPESPSAATLSLTSTQVQITEYCTKMPSILCPLKDMIRICPSYKYKYLHTHMHSFTSTSSAPRLYARQTPASLSSTATHRCSAQVVACCRYPVVTFVVSTTKYLFNFGTDHFPTKNDPLVDYSYNPLLYHHFVEER